MKSFLALLFLYPSLIVNGGAEPIKVPEAQISLYLSPDGGCTDAITSEPGKAQKTVCFQAYSFTSTAIAKALASAQKRGVKVVAVLDKRNRTKNYSSADYLANAGVAVFIDSQHVIAHNKVIVIDGQTVITGSFNFTKAAETSNAENLLVIHDVPLAKRYEDNFKLHRGHSEPYVAK